MAVCVGSTERSSWGTLRNCLSGDIFFPCMLSCDFFGYGIPLLRMAAFFKAKSPCVNSQTTFRLNNCSKILAICSPIWSCETKITFFLSLYQQKATHIRRKYRPWRMCGFISSTVNYCFVFGNSYFFCSKSLQLARIYSGSWSLRKFPCLSWRNNWQRHFCNQKKK